MKNKKYNTSKMNSLLIFCVFFNFSAISYAAKESMYGIFMVVKGDITVSNAKQAKQKVKVGDKVYPLDVVESAAESRAKIVMSDRNVINISPETKLEIQKYENDGEKNVEMNLLQGKVRNNVEQKYDGEKSKFIVKTPTAVAGVRGTQFLTGFDPSTRITSVVTLRGAVALAPVSVTGGQIKPVVVQKGESSSMAAGANPEQPKPVPKEELKKLDQESNASAATSKQDSGKEVASKDSSKKEESKKEDSKSESTKTEAASADAAPAETAQAESSTAKSETTQAESSSAQTESSPAQSDTVTAKDTRSPAADSSAAGAAAPSAAGSSMVDVGDMDAGQFTEIRAPTVEASQPLPPPPPLATPVAPPQPPQTIINDIINGNTGKARVIITPVPR